MVRRLEPRRNRRAFRARRPLKKIAQLRRCSGGEFPPGDPRPPARSARQGLRGRAPLASSTEPSAPPRSPRRPRRRQSRKLQAANQRTSPLLRSRGTWLSALICSRRKLTGRPLRRFSAARSGAEQSRLASRVVSAQRITRRQSARWPACSAIRRCMANTPRCGDGRGCPWGAVQRLGHVHGLPPRSSPCRETHAIAPTVTAYGRPRRRANQLRRKGRIA